MLCSLMLLLVILGIFLISKGFAIQKNIPKKIVTLKDSVLHYNKIITKGNGLYKEKDKYIFKGTEINNYLEIFNRMYRIVSIEKENIKLISSKNEGVFFLGGNETYTNSNIDIWLNKGENEQSGIYEKSIDNFENIEKNELDKYFNILNTDIYNDALGENSYLNNGESSFIINKDQKVFVKEENGLINEKINSNTSSGIRVILNLKGDVNIEKGTGSKKDPFIIKGSNHINKYVKLGKDLYQIYDKENNLFRLRKEETLDKKYKFSNKDSGFKPLNKNNIAYFLNNTYYNQLSYKKLLKTCTFYTGNILDDYNYLNIYNSKISAKVGLMNIFDLNQSGFVDGYYFVNTSKNESTISFSYDKFGHIIENESNVVKKIVPVICINQSDIVEGTGSKKNPYILEK